MKLVTFIKNGSESLGVRTENGVVDLKTALTAYPHVRIVTNIMEVIEGGEKSVAEIEEFINSLGANQIQDNLLDEANLEWGPCVTKPSKIICVGLNYRKHAEETGSPYPDYPILFNKFNNTLTGHQKDIAVPKITDKLDYEVELAIVIGKKAKNVSIEKALDYVFGYTIANDLSARDLQFKTPQWLLGKSCDDFNPLGPYLVTKEEVGDPQALSLRTIMNGKVRQESNTADMIFSCKEIISFISNHMTLLPGDVILTGTPEGVIMGNPEDQQYYIKSGDTVTVEIERLGSLSNRFVDEKQTNCI